MFSKTTFILVALGILLGGGLSFGQTGYVPIRLVGEGEPSPDTGDNIVTLSGTNPATSTGSVAVELDDAGATATDDYFWIDGSAFYRAGTTLVGSGSPTDFVDFLDTFSQLNDSLQLIWVGDNAVGDTLAVNDVLLLEDGQAAPGIAGRVFNNFDEPCIDAAGNLYFEVDLDGGTTDDEVLYSYPSGGAPAPLSSGVGIFREGQLIIGGPLDGQTWDDASAFNSLEVSNSGVLLIEAEVEPIIEVVVRVQPGQPYELLMQEGDSFLDLVNGISAPIETIGFISQARGNLNYAIEAKFDDAVLSTTTDDCVFADVGTGLQLIAQEGQDISAATGITGTTFGFFSSVSVNSSGKVVFNADIQDDGTNIPDYDEAYFMWDAGVLEMILTDEITLPGSANFLTNLENDVIINDQDRIFFQGDDGTADTLYEAVLPLVPSVEGLACMAIGSGTEIEATWTIPAGQTYDGIRIYVDGVLDTTLGGGATAYVSPTFTAPGLYEIGVEPFVGADDAPLASCSESIILPPDFTECSVPALPIPDLGAVTDILTFGTAVTIQDVSVSVNITHPDVDDFDEVSITSPLGTTVVLMDGSGPNAVANVDTTFADFGAPAESLPYNTGAVMQPQGPGDMADFRCESAQGDWALTVSDQFTVDIGTLDQWCLNIYEDPNPGLDCCPQKTDLLCANAGACAAMPAVNLSWTNNFVYNALELLRDDGTNQVVIPLGATDTSYSDTTVVNGESYEYTLRYQCAPGGTIQDSFSCSVFVDPAEVPAVDGLVCSPDPCGTGTVELSWTNGATYDSLTLNRAGVFLADVTGLSSFSDPTPAAGSATYSLVADCGGSTSVTNCVVDNTPPAVTDLTCLPDFCGNTVTLSWNENAIAYDSVSVDRAGVFLANVPVGQQSFVDTSPNAGTSTYTIRANCSGAEATTTCSVDNVLTLPDDLVCSAPLGSSDVTITWTNPVAYDSITILRDGLAVSPQPGPTDTIYVDAGLMQGAYTYDITFACPGGSDTLTCTVGVVTGSEFLLVPTDGGGPDGVDVFDPQTGAFLANLVTELDALDIYTATNAVVGPRNAGTGLTDLVMYIGDQTHVDASIVRYELDGTLLDFYIPPGTYDDVRGVEFPDETFTDDTLYFTTGTGDAIVNWDIGTATGTDYVGLLSQPTDLLFLDDGRLLVSDWGTDTVTLFDAAGMNPTVLLDSVNAMLDNPNQLAPLSNGNFLVGTEGTPNLIVEFTLAGTVVNSYDIGFNVQGVYELPSGLILFSTDDGSGVYTLDTSTSPATVTNVHDDSTKDFYYIELADFDGPGPVGDEFVRGDINIDGSVNIADAVYVLGNLFPAGGPPNVLECLDSADANDDGAINIADAISLLASLFGTPTVPLPAPNVTDGCGEDPTDGDALDCSSFAPCTP